MLCWFGANKSSIRSLEFKPFIFFYPPRPILVGHQITTLKEKLCRFFKDFLTFTRLLAENFKQKN